MRNVRSRIAAGAAGALAAGALAVVGTAGSASAAGDVGAQGTGVSTFHKYAVVHASPDQGSPDLGHLLGEGPDTPAKIYNGVCWAEGQHVDDGNFAHNKWVQVSNWESGTGIGWVWAGKLKGNTTGNVPNHC